MKWIVAGLFFSAATSGVAFAQEAIHPVVIELYTSQGCSSCPPADELLANLSKQKGVIALALHVDYWDYIGWKDTFGSPEFTDRQHSYARYANEKMVYTPQIIINGDQEKIVGGDAAKVAQRLQTAAGANGPVVTLSRSGDQLRVQATAQEPFPRGATVELVRYIPSATVNIERGENAGRQVFYTNIVTSLKLVADWDGASPLDIYLDAAGELPVAVLIQEPGPGAILGAATLH